MLTFFHCPWVQLASFSTVSPYNEALTPITCVLFLQLSPSHQRTWGGWFETSSCYLNETRVASGIEDVGYPFVIVKKGWCWGMESGEGTTKNLDKIVQTWEWQSEAKVNFSISNRGEKKPTPKKQPKIPRPFSKNSCQLKGSVSAPLQSFLLQKRRLENPERPLPKS